MKVFNIKRIFFSIVLLTVNIYATSSFLKDQGIVDIGRVIPSKTEIVGKSLVSVPPVIKTVPNLYVYRSRVQSPVYNCGTDAIGHESCEFEETRCPSSYQYTNATSVLHHVDKTLYTLCPAGTIRQNGLCYIAVAGHKKDFRQFSQNYTAHSQSICADNTAWFRASQNNTTLKVGIWAGTHNCGGSGMWWLSKINVPSTIQVGAVHVSYSAGCLGNGHLITNTNSSQTVTSSQCTARGAQHPYVSFKYYFSYTNCPSGYTSDGMYCYQHPHCPQYTTLQSNGTCKLEYNWYSYVCPADTNKYANPWIAINPGHDCGNGSCTNSPTPPPNDCERVTYTCPLNPNEACAQIQKGAVTCPSGYVYQDNVCERKATFCGSSYYNSQLDVCQNIKTYTKLCTDPSDVYNPKLNICESGHKACPNGFYNKTLGVCQMNYIISCPTPGYTYDVNLGYCVNPNQMPCRSGYHYDASKHECIGPQVCPSGTTYNAVSHECQTNICGLYGTVDGNNGNCELPNIDCHGTVTSSGQCIPTHAQ